MPQAQTDAVFQRFPEFGQLEIITKRFCQSCLGLGVLLTQQAIRALAFRFATFNQSANQIIGQNGQSQRIAVFQKQLDMART